MKRFWVAVGSVALVSGLCDFVFNGILLKDLYQETASLWRPMAEMKSLAWLAVVTYFLFAWIFVVVYGKGYEKDKAGIGQGLRYGFLIGLLLCSVFSLGCYVLMPIPAVLAVCWFVGGMAECMIAGMVAGVIYKP